MLLATVWIAFLEDMSTPLAVLSASIVVWANIWSRQEVLLPQIAQIVYRALTLM